MRLIKMMVVCLLGFWLGTAHAADTGFTMSDEEFADNAMAAHRTQPAPLPKYSYDITAHSNCVLENSKNVQQTPIQANRVSEACRHKATPKKCRDVSAMPPDNKSKSPQEICGEACAAAGMWSRKYGDCSLD